MSSMRLLKCVNRRALFISPATTPSSTAAAYKVCSRNSFISCALRTRQIRFQSTETTTATATEETAPTTTTNTNEQQQEEEKKYKPFIAPTDEQRFERLALNLEEARDALNKLTSVLESAEFSSQISQISQMSNETELFAKFAKYTQLMINAREKVIAQYQNNFNRVDPAKRVPAFRLSIGKWTLKDEDLLNQVRQLDRTLAKKVFNIELPEQFAFPDRVAINIFQDASFAANRRIYESRLQEVMGVSPDTFAKDIFAPVLFEEEMRLLKEQEKLMAVSKKKKVMYDTLMEKLKEDATDVLTEEWEKRAAMDFDKLEPEDERFVLATPEGWISMKFQLSECMHRLG